MHMSMAASFLQRLQRLLSSLSAQTALTRSLWLKGKTPKEKKNMKNGCWFFWWEEKSSPAFKDSLMPLRYSRWPHHTERSRSRKTHPAEAPTQLVMISCVEMNVLHVPERLPSAKWKQEEGDWNKTSIWTISNHIPGGNPLETFQQPTKRFAGSPRQKLPQSRRIEAKSPWSSSRSP